MRMEKNSNFFKKTQDHGTVVVGEIPRRTAGDRG